MTSIKFLLMLFLFLYLFQCSPVTTQVKPVESKKEVKSSTQKINEQRILKRKVAIARFSNETTYGKGLFYDGKNDKLAKQAHDILAAKLAQTGKFILLERSDLEAINKELKMGGLGHLNIPADYLIIGSVSEFGRETKSDVGVFSRKKIQVAKAKVFIRLVDVSTGQIIYSEEGAGEASSEALTVVGLGGREGYNSALNDKAIEAAISKVVDNLIKNLLDKPWKSYILDYQDGNYIISGGKQQGIQINDVFQVYKKGKKVKNPQTGFLIELPGKKVATIQVIAQAGNTAEDEISICKLISGELPSQNFGDYVVKEK